MIAYGLVKKGVEFTLASQHLQSHHLEGRKEDSTKDPERRMLEISWQVGEEMQPLIQWSPNNTHWLEWKTIAESEHLDVKSDPGNAGSHKKVLGEWNPTDVEHLGLGTEFSFTAAYEKALNECNNLTRSEHLALHPASKNCRQRIAGKDARILPSLTSARVGSLSPPSNWWEI